MTAVEQLKVLVKAFEIAQTDHAKAGTYDTEPCIVFQQLLVDAVCGRRPTVPSDWERWQLYADEDDGPPQADVAAAALTTAARACVRCIEATTVAELPAVETYLKGYCDRIVMGWRKR